MELTGIILSGGKSSRLGKENGVCLLQGKPLIEYSFDLLKNFCDSIIISSSSNDYEYLGCQIVKDEIQGIGPAGGIFSCLRASGNDENFIMSCDMPMLTDDLIRFLLSQKKMILMRLFPYSMVSQSHFVLFTTKVAFLLSKNQ